MLAEGSNKYISGSKLPKTEAKARIELFGKWKDGSVCGCVDICTAIVYLAADRLYDFRANAHSMLGRVRLHDLQ